MRIRLLLGLAAFILLTSTRIMAQPFFFLNNSPENGDFYTPGETVTALFTIYEDGNLGTMRVTPKAGGKVIYDLQPAVVGTDHFPPNIKEYTLYINIPSDFAMKDSVFIFEVSASVYGTHTIEFKVKTASAAVDDNSLANGAMLFPNPATEIVTIESPLITEFASVSLVNSLGETVPAKFVGTANSETCTINATGLSRGIYTVMITSSKGLSCRKLILQ